MSKVIKIILFFIFFILLALYFFFSTAIGHKLSYALLSYALTEKTGVLTKVQSLDLHSYPYMKGTFRIDDTYALALDGYYENKSLNLRYTLKTHCLESTLCKIDDDVFIKGYIEGPLTGFSINGKGTALDGRIQFKGIKKKDLFKDVNIVLTQFNSTKLFRLLGQTALLQGEANGTIHFDTISQNKRKGSIHYQVHAPSFYKQATTLIADIGIKDDKHSFNMKIHTPSGDIKIDNGHYDQKTKYADALYTIDIKDISDLKSFIDIDYKGRFQASGRFDYAEYIKLSGVSQSLGGTVTLRYEKKKLHFQLDTIPLQTLAKKLNFTDILHTNINGNGYYDLNKKSLTLDGTLSPLSLKENNLSKIFMEKTKIDISQEIFNNNHIHIQTKNRQIHSDISLKNSQNHLIFNNTVITKQNHSIQSNIDIKLHKHTIKGNVLVKLDTFTDNKDTFIDFNGVVEQYYALTLKGLLSPTWTTIDYTLHAKRVPSHLCTIVDDINLSGHLSGDYNRLHLEGKGSIFDGKVNYQAIKNLDTLEDIHLTFTNIHSQKLSTLLGYPNVPYGKTDINASFKILNKNTKHGKINFHVHQASYEKLPLSLNGHILIQNQKSTFDSNITLDNARIELSKGKYNFETQKIHAFYSLNIKDLTPFKSLLGYGYKGSFYALGTVDYHKNMSIHGLSKTFDGLTEFDYRDNALRIDLNNTSFKSIMELFPYPLMIDAKSTGNILYDFTKEKLYVKTKLHQAKFLHTSLIDTIYSKSGVNMLRETFPQSTLDLTLHKNILLGNLILKNKNGHFLLTHTTLNTNQNSINAHFDLKMQEKEFSGTINGLLSHPKINLNMQKLLEHEMDRKLDSLLGEDNRKMMENMPMGSTAKDMATGMGGAFMGMFF
jgi:hypothetical protein